MCCRDARDGPQLKPPVIRTLKDMLAEYDHESTP